MIKYRHYRQVNEVATPVGPLLQVNSRGGATLAFTDDTVSSQKVYVGSFAFCNPKDNYNKHYGRAKSAGKLRQNAATGYKITDNDRHFIIKAETAREFLSLMDEHMLELGYVPH
jgi:hypothetical protein